MRILNPIVLTILATSCVFERFLAMESKEKLDLQLLAAAEGRDETTLEKMCTLIAQGADPRCHDARYHSPLSNAVISGSLTKVRYLLDDCHVDVDFFTQFMARVKLGHFKKESPEQQNALAIIEALDARARQQSAALELSKNDSSH